MIYGITHSFCFFFFENPFQCLIINQEIGLSAEIKVLIFRGTDSIETVKEEQNLALFAKVSSTKLPCL